jgi:hypothetical protein
MLSLTTIKVSASIEKVTSMKQLRASQRPLTLSQEKLTSIITVALLTEKREIFQMPLRTTQQQFSLIQLISRLFIIEPSAGIKQVNLRKQRKIIYKP